ncbi:VCBS repeat-containing protein [Streptomyces sp. NPDC020875]|uniref:VCBS repeat-containing protein n=1 Tax=Streptomyces sp. NPDC020875 TaxID=3154898 RepID=UPI0033E5DA61
MFSRSEEAPEPGSPGRERRSTGGGGAAGESAGGRRRPSGYRALASLSALLLAGGALTVSTTPAAAAICTAGTDSDFNGDGIRDLAVADAQATVNGLAGAGLVRVVLGGGKGESEISQAMSNDGAAPEAGDQFGYSIAVHDANQDGCSDLVIGAPYEDITVGTEVRVDAGAVYVVHGRPTGIGEGSVVDNYTQKGLDIDATVEANDFFGFAVAAGTTSTGKPFMAVGTPGEKVGTFDDAGAITYRQGTGVANITQNDPGVPGTAEIHDRFGAAIAATSRYLVVGMPGEALGPQTGAGAVAVFNHTVTADKRPTPILSLNEDSQGMNSGTGEEGDRFGASLAMIPYRTGSSGTEADALLAVGAPTEDSGQLSDTGAVTVVRVQPDGTFTELNLFDRLAPGVLGDPVLNDHFGQRVALARTGSGAANADWKLAVSVPGQDVGAAENTGAVQIIPARGAPQEAAQRLLTRGDGLLPDTPGVRDFTGMGLWASNTELFVGAPGAWYGGVAKGAAYTVPWSLIAGGTGTVTTVRPGTGTIPDVGTSFGSSVR